MLRSLPCHAALCAALAGLAALAVPVDARAFEVVPADRTGARSFSLGGASGEPALSGFRVMPYAASGGDGISRLPVWRENGRIATGETSAFQVGTTSHLDRRFVAVKPAADRFSDVFAIPQAGAFVNFRDNGMELGRIAVTTGMIGGIPRGFDIAATRSFGLADGLSLNFGPTLSFGEAERFGFASQAWTGTRLGATGATLGLERALSPQTTASFSASYALVHSLPGQAIQPQGGRNRFDIGLTLSTKLLGN